MGNSKKVEIMQAPNFTIKHETKTGDVILWPCTFVGIVGGDEMEPGESVKYPKRVEFDRSDGIRGTIDSGRVYVMNSAGKTVEVVHLGLLPPKDA